MTTPMSENPEKVSETAKDAISFIKSAHSEHSSDQIGGKTHSKLENTQNIGLHKAWGVHHKTLMTIEEECQRGSTMVLVGNYVQGAVHVVKKHGRKVITATFSAILSTKANWIWDHGVDATSHGDAHDELHEHVSQTVEEKGTIPAYLPDDSDAAIGQGITVTETTQESFIADHTTVLAGGGGSTIGAVASVKTSNLKTKATGAELVNVVSTMVVPKVGELAETFSVDMTVDGMVAKKAGENTPLHVQENTDQTSIAEDDESAGVPSDTAENYKTTAENLGSPFAVGPKQADSMGKKVAVTPSGGNTDATMTLLAAQYGSTQWDWTPLALASSFDCFGQSAGAVLATVDVDVNATKSDYNQPASINWNVVAESWTMTEVHGLVYKQQTTQVSEDVGHRFCETAVIPHQNITPDNKQQEDRTR